MWKAMQALAMEARKKIVLGQRLSPQSVNEVAYGISRADIDPVVLENLSKGFPGKYNLLPPPPDFSTFSPDLLSVPESKAALLVTLHKLLLGSVKVRKSVPLVICEALNTRIQIDSDEPLFAVSRLFYQEQHATIRKSEESIEIGAGNGKYEVGIALEELEALKVSTADCTSLGAAALTAHIASQLVVIADVVAGISCEALRVKSSVFEDKIYRQDSTHSSVADSAKSIKSLLWNSTLVSPRKGFEAEFVASIPEVHGSLKECLKNALNLLRVEMNRISSSTDKLTTWPSSSFRPTSPQLGYLLVDAFKSLISSLSRLISYSFSRSLEAVKNSEADMKLVRGYFNELKFVEAETVLENKRVIFRRALLIVNKAMDAMALEAAVALRLIAQHQSHPKMKVVVGRGSSKCLAAFVSETGDLQDSFMKIRGFFASKDGCLEEFGEDLRRIIEESVDKRLPQVPKGTRDFGPEQMMIREKAFNIISKVFKKHGAASIDTPVFELKETLMGKYGEDSKLIYDLADQGGQMLSLRYDLTVPFARYIATNNLTNMKRYHIAKVYRRDNPSQGRYREFYQCDFDIAGKYPPMVPDAEVIKVLTELLDELDIGSYEVKLNHRKLLDGMLAICGVPSEKFRTICSAIDKLDKTPWEKVRSEMVNEKGLSAEVADKIGIHVARKGESLKVLAELKQQQEYLDQTGSCQALEELSTLFDYLEAANCLDRVVFDMSLARGLDYYTGVIYEAVFKGTTQVGSIAAGGRYDNLVGGFSSKQVPAVGVSLGIERVFLIMEQLEKERGKAMRTNETEVQVFFLGNTMMKKAVQLANELWSASIKAEFDAISPSKLKNKLGNVLDAGVPYVVIVGEDEERKGIVKLKEVKKEKDDKDEGQDIEREKLIPILKELLKH